MARRMEKSRNITGQFWSPKLRGEMITAHLEVFLRWVVFLMVLMWVLIWCVDDVFFGGVLKLVKGWG